jgi:hypothetical protein
VSKLRWWRVGMTRRRGRRDGEEKKEEEGEAMAEE